MEENRNSAALDQLPEDLQMSYDMLLSRNREEIRAIEGLTSVHDMLLERFTFLYVALRHMERDWQNLDPQRYNQLLSLWIKVGSDLLHRYREVYAAGAMNELFITKMMEIVVKEVDDDEIIRRIRAQIEVAAKETANI